MKKGIQVSKFYHMLYDVKIRPEIMREFGQCSPATVHYLARRKVLIVADLFARKEWNDWGIVRDEFAHLVLVCNPQGNSECVPTYNVERLPSKEAEVWPVHKWNEPNPMAVMRGHNRIALYYSKTGELWNNTRLIGNFDKLHSDKNDEVALCRMMEKTTLIHRANEFDPNKYLVSTTYDFATMFAERRAALIEDRRQRAEARKKEKP